MAGASDAGGGAVVGYVYHIQQSMLYILISHPSRTVGPPQPPLSR